MSETGGVVRTVKQGESVESIAFEYGHFWETLWKDPRNAALGENRKDPHVLFPGDIVYVPELREKSVERTTDQDYLFRRRGVPSWLRVIVEINGKARAGEPYILDIDGEEITGFTGADGAVEHPVMPNAKLAKLTVGMDGEFEQRFELRLRELDPSDSLSGIRGRLRNLGFLGESTPEHLDEDTRKALADFQRSQGIAPSGNPDPRTQQALVAEHGS